MNTRLTRIFAKAAAAAGTAGTIALTCWLLDRMLTPDGRQVIERSNEGNDSMDDQQQACDENESFALLPVVSESDEDSEEEAVVGYTDDSYTPQHDVCMLSVSVETLAGAEDDDVAVDTSSCRLCRVVDDYQCDIRDRSLSFADTDSSSGDSVRSNSIDQYEEKTGSHMESPCDRNCRPRRTENWLYVRL
ncbi:hypothetical protein PHYBOEH_009623 [Phytophthora boehmeriae]|uniref:Uncharacterized protein n=1 Tax=Phytophthora boehmeriae TaxID=109152 RepID=A0A8T1X532_9STRA|nr:hypothetical protein PHYBOEH_009623 [Phytophthora boehmeriae]